MKPALGFALLLVLHLRDMPARGRRGNGVERERVFAAAVHQALIAHGLPAGLGEELLLERHAAADEPVEVGDAARAIVGDAVLVGAGTHRHVEECPHVFDGILEATSLLQRSATAQVDEPARHGRRSTPRPGAFQHQHVGVGAGGFDGSGGTRDAVAGNDDVSLVIPRRDRGRREWA